LQPSKQIYSLTALNKSIERLIRTQLGDRLFWVVAEVIKSQEKNGHHYLDLVDSVDGKRTAELKATFWFSAYHATNVKLNNELPSILKKGNKVLLQLKVEFHPVYGLKANILDVDPSITYGEIEKQKKETLARLQKEGLDVLQKQLYLPPVLKKIGLIGSPNSSGFRDFLNELFENDIYRNFKIKEFPTSVQGERAEKEIIKAIEKAQAYNLDVLVIIRGGGSKMDLNVFNQYALAAAISMSTIPIMTGIGHESDGVVADIMAHKAHITPTAVAKFIYIRAGIFRSSVEDAYKQIVNESERLISSKKEKFSQLSNYIIFYTQETLSLHSNYLRETLHGLHLLSSELFESKRSGLRMSLSKIADLAQNNIDFKRMTDLSNTVDRMQYFVNSSIRQEHVQIENLNNLLDLLNPEALLLKGYTISTIDKVDVKDITEDMVGKEMKTLSANHLIVSKIVKVN
jgi:exodeoxyribonuclease VII large subunit